MDQKLQNQSRLKSGVSLKPEQNKHVLGLFISQGSNIFYPLENNILMNKLYMNLLSLEILKHKKICILLQTIFELLCF